ncbi:MAG: hypothetical protein ACREPV_13845 [Lysobacter sp.]
MTTITEALDAMFPSDPLIPAMVSACDRDPASFAVYCKCEGWRRFWDHPSTDKNLAAYLRNPEWPRRAVDLCRRYGVPTPTWAAAWAVAVALNETRRPSNKDLERAELLDAVLVEITEPGPNGPGARLITGGLALAAVPRGYAVAPVVADALGLKLDTAERLVNLLSAELSSLFDAPVITTTGKAAGKKTV